MATITVEEVKEFISTSLPDSVISAFISNIDKADSCLAGYDLTDEEIQTMKLYAVAHMIETSSRGDIKSQGAPSGASRSFRDGTGLAGTQYGMTMQMMTGYTCLEAIIDSSNTLFFKSISPKYGKR